MDERTQPLRQLPDEDLEPIATHEVEGDTSITTRHIPGRPIDEPRPDNAPLVDEYDVADTAVEDRAGLVRLIDVVSPEAAYRSKDNIVLPPEDVPALSDEQLEAILAGEGDLVAHRGDAVAELDRRAADREEADVAEDEPVEE